MLIPPWCLCAGCSLRCLPDPGGPSESRHPSLWDLGHGRSGEIPQRDPTLLQRSSRCAAGLRHQQKGKRNRHLNTETTSLIFCYYIILLCVFVYARRKHLSELRFGSKSSRHITSQDRRSYGWWATREIWKRFDKSQHRYKDKISLLNFSKYSHIYCSLNLWYAIPGFFLSSCRKDRIWPMRRDYSSQRHQRCQGNKSVSCFWM